MTRPRSLPVPPVGLAWLAASLGCTPTVCNTDQGAPSSQGQKPLVLDSQSRGEHSKTQKSIVDQINGLRHTKNGSYEQPDASVLKEYREWLKGSFKGAASKAAAPKGFSLRTGEDPRISLLAEENNERGAAIVLVRKDYAADVIIEVPHSFFDSGTLPIGLSLFDELGARALVLNSYHRGGSGGEAERKKLALSGQSPFDVAHQRTSYFQAAHTAALEVVPQAWVVQIHGFAASRAEGVDAIVSPGPTSTDLAPFVDRLRSQIPEFEFRLFPRDIRTLGGTTNAQGKKSLGTSSPFIHLEMSPRLRDRLGADEQVMKRFALAFWESKRGR